MEFCPLAFLYLKELLLAHCFLVRGTSFSVSLASHFLSFYKSRSSHFGLLMPFWGKMLLSCFGTAIGLRPVKT